MCSKGAFECTMFLFREPALMERSWSLICALLDGGNVHAQSKLKGK
jgi:hypothetical protein